jgi:hypothetical protein
MSRLYDWVFHYNHFTELWHAVPREMYNRYWDNDDIKGVLKSKDINTLIEIITKGIKVK